jgi:Leucine-rich repeat (LRR) protein
MTFACAAASLLLVVAALTAGVRSLKAEMRPASSADVHLPIDWKHRFNVIAAVINDDEFQESLREVVREKGSKPINYCLFTVVTCNENFIIESFNIKDMKGYVDFSKIPQGVTGISVTNSAFSEPLDLTKLPFWVKTVNFNDVSFAPGNAKLTKRHSTLWTLICRSCGLTKVEWETLPAVTHLDLSGNPLGDFLPDKLPGTLRLLNLSRCGVVMDSSNLKSLPSAVLTLDLSHNKIRGIISDVVFPSALEYLDLSNNELEGALVMDNLPFSLWSMLLGQNKISGEIGDLTQFLMLKNVDISSNKITSMRFDQLGPQLQHLNVRNNQISGSLDLGSLVPTLLTLDVSGNHLDGAADLSKIPPLLEHLDISHNSFSGPVALDKFSENIRFIYLQNNKFTGNPDLTNLPVDVRRVLIYGNDWDSLMPPMEKPTDGNPKIVH